MRRRGRAAGAADGSGSEVDEAGAAGISATGGAVEDEAEAID
jgi:hypothetical protein